MSRHDELGLMKTTGPNVARVLVLWHQSSLSTVLWRSAELKPRSLAREVAASATDYRVNSSWNWGD